MAKRTLREKEAAIEPAESEFQVGVLVSYYDGGWRCGHITEDDIDDNGQLVVTIKPVGPKGKSMRCVTYPVSQLKIPGGS